MGFGAYESLVGWRYLLRRRRRLLLLAIGVVLLLIGAGLVAAGVSVQQSQGGAVSVFGNRAGAAQTLMGVGGGLATLGGCVALFGLLNAFLTIFAAFSAFMVTIGVAEVILVLAVMNGFQGDLRGKIIDTYAHVLVESAAAGGHLAEYRAIAAQARAVADVTGASPLLTTEVMVSSRSNLAAVVVAGIDIDTIGEANQLPRFLRSGSLTDLRDPEAVEAQALQERLDRPRFGRPEPEPAEDVEGPTVDLAALGGMPFPAPSAARPAPLPTLLMGDELRKSLGLWPGERLNVISPFGELGPQGPVPKSRPFRMAGWFASGMLEFDSKLAYADLGAVQHFLGLDDVASAVQVRTQSLDAARPVRDALQAILGPSVRVTDWQERNRNLFSALKLEKIAMFLVLTINILLAAFSITSTLVMTIIERRREIAILTAMGSSQGAIVRIFMSQGGLTGLVGSALGATIGVGGALALSRLRLPLDNDVYYISAIPVELRVADVVAIVGVALLVSLVSTVYPALYAAALRPVEGLKA